MWGLLSTDISNRLFKFKINYIEVDWASRYILLLCWFFIKQKWTYWTWCHFDLAESLFSWNQSELIDPNVFFNKHREGASMRLIV